MYCDAPVTSLKLIAAATIALFTWLNIGLDLSQSYYLEKIRDALKKFVVLIRSKKNHYTLDSSICKRECISNTVHPPICGHLIRRRIFGR